jgi:hypothetical protein
MYFVAIEVIRCENDRTDPAAPCCDWHISDADSISARDTFDPTLDAGYTTAGISYEAKLLIRLLRFWEESIYELLGGWPTIRSYGDRIQDLERWNLCLDKGRQSLVRR